MSINNKLTKVRSILKRHGLKEFIVCLLRIIFWQGFGHNSCRIFLFELSTPQHIPDNGHTFRFASIDDIRTYHSDPDWNIRDRDVLAFERGDRCLLQFDGDILVGFAWIAASHLVEIMWGFHFNMPNDTVYNYHSFTAPAYRGKGFQALRHLKLLEHIKATGQHRLFGYVDQTNLNSLKGIRKSGYKRIGVLRCVKKHKKVKFCLKVSKDLWSNEKRS
jgi:RimJ/RimL family protein N-acetyltransferase